MSSRSTLLTVAGVSRSLRPSRPSVVVGVTGAAASLSTRTVSSWWPEGADQAVGASIVRAIARGAWREKRDRATNNTGASRLAHRECAQA